MDSLNKMTDEELCALAVCGDRNAEEVLVARYYGLVRACARPFFLAGGDGEDLTQEGMFGLIRAIREYDDSRETSFRVFAERCIRNRLLSALRGFSRGKHSPLNHSIPLDVPFFDYDSYTTVNQMLSRTDPEVLIVSRDWMEHVLQGVRKQLSEFETKILGFYLDGLSCQEIADEMGKSKKSVDNAVQRVRRKIARQIESGEISRS